MKERCRPNDHHWEQMRGGRERCRMRKLTYPCLLDCPHLDYHVDKKQEMPLGVTYLGTFENGTRIDT